MVSRESGRGGCELSQGVRVNTPLLWQVEWKPVRPGRVTREQQRPGVTAPGGTSPGSKSQRHSCLPLQPVTCKCFSAGETCGPVALALVVGSPPSWLCDLCRGQRLHLLLEQPSCPPLTSPIFPAGASLARLGCGASRCSRRMGVWCWHGGQSSLAM